MQTEWIECFRWHCQGTGVLTFDDKVGVGVDWQAVQTAAGELFLTVRANNSTELGRDDLTVLLELVPEPQLLGHDSSGFAVVARVGGHANAVHASNAENGWTTLRAKEIKRTLPDGESVAYKFAILNLYLDALPEAEFDLEGLRVMFRPVDDYAAAVSTLYSRGRYAETVNLTIATADHLLACSVADRVCELASYAMGCRVSWLRFDGLNDLGDTVRGSVFNAITGPYSPLRLLYDASFWQFLQAHWVSYSEFRGKSIKPARMLLGLITNATSADDFLELRGLKLSAFVEVLARIVIDHDPSPFTKKRDEQEFHEKLRAHICELADALLADPPEAPGRKAKLIEQMTEKTRDLVRPPFREMIAKLCGSLNIAVEDEEIAVFVKMRNELVHESRYVSQRAKQPSEWRFDTPDKEYFWMVRFADRLVLRFLGYRGAFIDRLARDGSEFPSDPP